MAPRARSIRQSCNCNQVAIRPGCRSLPFVDFLGELRKLDLEHKHLMMKKGNWELFASGSVTWSDVVTRSRVRELHEVMDCKWLTIPQMVAAGISKEDAEAAWGIVHTPERLAADAKRSEVLKDLRRNGLSTDEIAKALAGGIASHVIASKNAGQPGS
jgi:hypothetical protein